MRSGAVRRVEVGHQRSSNGADSAVRQVKVVRPQHDGDRGGGGGGGGFNLGSLFGGAGSAGGRPPLGSVMGMGGAGGRGLPALPPELQKTMQGLAKALEQSAAQPSQPSSSPPQAEEQKAAAVQMSVGEARSRLEEDFTEQTVSEERDTLEQAALRLAQESGIVFIDEIDKVAAGTATAEYRGGAAHLKGEGVQKELLALLEGTTVQTPLGQPGVIAAQGRGGGEARLRCT